MTCWRLSVCFRVHSADHYLQEAKKLKHNADALVRHWQPAAVCPHAKTPEESLDLRMELNAAVNTLSFMKTSAVVH